jgi:hypothetical protein
VLDLSWVPTGNWQIEAQIVSVKTESGHEGLLIAAEKPRESEMT